MKNNLTEVVFILDRSGSMEGLEKDTIGGFNSFIKKQCQLEGDVNVTAILFDDQYEVLYDNIDGNQAKLTDEQYYVRGCTALLDAIGKTIINIGRRLEHTEEGLRPSKVIFVITTDGLENASQEFSYKRINQMITHQQDKYKWEFIFLGANIDVKKEGRQLGVKEENTCQ